MKVIVGSSKLKIKAMVSINDVIYLKGTHALEAAGFGFDKHMIGNIASDVIDGKYAKLNPEIAAKALSKRYNLTPETAKKVFAVLVDSMKVR